MTRERDPELGWYQEGWLDLPPELPFEEWEEVGKNLHRWERSVGFWLGDWWRYGERRYGERASQAAPTGYAAKTLDNAARVAENFEPSRRRTPQVPFSYHEAVVGLDPERADELLVEAERRPMKREELRSKVRHLRMAEVPDPTGLCETLACSTCQEMGPTVDCRQGQATVDRGFLCSWLGDHVGHDKVVLDEDQVPGWQQDARVGPTSKVG